MERRRNAPYMQHVQRSADRVTSRQGVFPYPRPTDLRHARRKTGLEIPSDTRLEQVRRIADLERERRLQRSPFEGLGNKELPIAKERQKIVETIANNKVTLLDGETGSGKSTQLWQYLLGEGYDKVVVLVPRRVIANNLYERGQDELREQIGEEYLPALGIAHGERSENVDDGKVIFMTPNTYTRMAQEFGELFGDQRVAVISDEIHEANLYTEIATGIAAMQVEEHEQWRLVLSSATHDHHRLEAVYSRLNESDKLPHVTVEGRPFDLAITEQPEQSPSEVYTDIGEQHERTMIFTNGVREIGEVIEQARAALEAKRPGSSQHVEFRILHSKLTPAELDYVAAPNPDGRRVVIVSSPAGMSGITIPGVTLVISDGTLNREVLDSDGVPGLFRYYASQGELIQMGGRAGRDVAGGQLVIAKPVELKETVRTRRPMPVQGMPFVSFADREKHAPAEIYNTHMGRTILGTGSQGYDFERVNNYIPHAVSDGAIIEGRELLLRLGAIDDDYQVTARGKKMDAFPISPELSRSVVEAVERPGVSRVQLGRTGLIAAAISVGGLQDFSYTAGKEWQKLLTDQHPSSDYMAQLDLTFALRDMHETRELRRRDIDPVKLQHARKVAKKIFKVLGVEAHNLDISPANPDEADELHSIFLAGMLDKVYRRTGGGGRRGTARYVGLHDGEAETERELSDRSVMARTAAPALIAADPRRFRTHAQPDIEHQIVEMAFPVRQEELVELVRREGLVEQHLADTRVNALGHVVDIVRSQFGSLALGSDEERPARRETLTPRAQQVLFDAMNKHHGASLKALYEIKHELDQLQHRVGRNQFASLLRPGRTPLSEGDVHRMMRDVCQRATSLSHADRLLGEEIYARGLNLDHFIEHRDRSVIEKRAPLLLRIGSTEWPVHYHNGEAYLTLSHDTAPLRQLTTLQLPDGRDVLIQVTKQGGRGVERVSLAEAKQRLFEEVS